jgi:hypothetical protein
LNGELALFNKEDQKKPITHNIRSAVAFP